MKTHQVFFGTIIIFAMLICLGAQGAWAGWVYETIASTGDQGKYASMAIAK